MGTVNLNEKNMMSGFNMGGKHELPINALIFISKWYIWKARNKVKYDKKNPPPIKIFIRNLYIC